jgi:hypothetical protein
MRTSAYHMILNKYEYFLKETVCSLLYQTNLKNTWPYLHISIKSYNTQYAMDYIYICTQRGFKYTNYGKWMPLQKIMYYRILLIWFLIQKNNLMCFPYEQQVSLQLSQEVYLIKQRNFSQMWLWDVLIRIFRWMVFLNETLRGQN